MHLSLPRGVENPYLSKILRIKVVVVKSKVKNFKIPLVSSLLLLLIMPLVAHASEQPVKTIRVGYFEGGKYPIHELLRDEYFKQLKLITPAGFNFVPTPSGFYSAVWNRDTCREMAKDLAKNDQVDIVLAVGPWVVEDLIAAGFKKPILGVHQFAPFEQGLLDQKGRPVVSNLTLQQDPGKIVRDLSVLSKLIPVKRLGVLYFPSGDEGDSVINLFRNIGKRLGFEVLTADGYNNVGTFAYFKAFERLDKNIDALYLPPLWGFDMVKLDEFFKRTNDAKIPTFVSDGKILLEKGAFATASYYDVVSEARNEAFKTVQIAQGATPGDLAVNFQSGLGLALNEQTALTCGKDIPDQVLNDFFVLDAGTLETAPHYTLAEAINRATNQNPGYLSKYDALEAASHAGDVALADYLPQLNGVVAVSRLDKDLSRYAGGVLDKNQVVAGLDFQQQIFSYGTIKAIQIAGKKKNLARMDLRQAQLDLELAVSQAYFSFLRAMDIKKALVNNRNLAEYNLELARAMNQLQAQDTVDIIRLEDERYRLTAQVTDARKNVRVARVVLNALFNLPGDSPFTLDTGSYSEPAFWSSEEAVHGELIDRPSQEKLTERLVGMALQQDPSIGRYDLLTDVAHNELSRNTGSFLPEIGFRASMDYADRITDNSGFPTGRSSWTVGGVLRWPLFVGSQRVSQRKQLKAMLSETEYMKDAASLAVMRDVTAGVHHLVASANISASTYQSQAKAYQALDLIVAGYGAQKVDLIKLLDFQKNALDADLASINSRYDYFGAVAGLVRSVGLSSGEQSNNLLTAFRQLISQ